MKLQESINYDQFIIMDFNRDVSRIKPLEASMKRHGWIPAYPAHVIKKGNKYEVKAGHHRITAAMNLGLPIIFVVCEDNASVFELEKATTQWSVNDYLTSYVRIGDADYLTVQRYYQSTGIPLGLCVSMLAGETAGSGNKLNLFKSGEYIIKDTAHADTVAQLISYMKNHNLEWANQSSSVQAISRIVFCGHAELPRFREKIKKYSYTLKKQGSLLSYLNMYENLYNHNAHGNKVPITFLTQDTMAKRKLGFGRPTP